MSDQFWNNPERERHQEPETVPLRVPTPEQPPATVRLHLPIPLRRPAPMSAPGPAGQPAGLPAGRLVSGPRPPAGRQRTWERLLIAFSGVLTLSLLAGLTYWATGYSSSSATSRPQQDRAPFYGAIVALAGTPAVEYQSSSNSDGTSVDAWVTSQGEVNGTITVDGEDFGLLVVGGKTYVKPPADLLSSLVGSSSGTDASSGSAADLLKDRWITGGEAETELGPDTNQLSTPAQLAQRLLSALNGTGATYPLIGSNKGTTVDGVPALTADTPLGDISVSMDEPYRVLQITAPDKATATASSTGSSASGSSPSGSSFFSIPSSAMSVLHRLPALFTSLGIGSGESARQPGVRDADFESGATGTRSAAQSLPVLATVPDGDFSSLKTSEPTTQKAVDAPLEADEKDTDQLATAVSEDVQFSLQGNAQINCSTSGCVVTATVTGQVSSTSTRTKVLGGTVSAHLDASVEIDGIPSAGCQGDAELPVNGTGSITCDDAAAGGLMQSQIAEKKAAAQAQSEAEDGASVPYQVDYTGEALVTATAMAEVAVQELVQQQQQEQQTADDSPNPYATSPDSPDSADNQDSATATDQPSGSASSSASSSATSSAGQASSGSGEPGVQPSGGTQPTASTSGSAQQSTAPEVSLNPYEPVPAIAYDAPAAPSAAQRTAPGEAGTATAPGTADTAGSEPAQNGSPVGQASAEPEPTQTPKTCLDERPGGAEDAGEGWITYSAGTNGRASTAVACLKDASGPGTNPSVDPVGWTAAGNKVRTLGLTGYPIARCHVIAATLGGSNNRTDNLVPCWQNPVNSSDMRKVEIAVGKYSVGAVVLYTVSPLYKTEKSTIPDAILMQAYAVYPSGNLEWIESLTVPNAITVAGKSYNLGL